MESSPAPFPSFLAQIPLIIVAILQTNNFVCPPFPFEVFGTACTLLVTFIKLLDEFELDVLDRLCIFGPELSGGKDYYSELSKCPIKFWYLTGETLDSFQAVVQQMRLPIIHFQQRNTTRVRIQSLDITNRILLTFIWLRRYPRVQDISTMFRVDISYVSKTTKYMVPLLLENYSREVTWPSLDDWSSWQGYWDKFPTCVGIIEGTIHPIWRPSRRQRLFYRGDKKKHFMASHLIVLPDGKIAHCSAAYPGHLNDINCFNLMPSLGPGSTLDLPLNCHIMADGGYPPHPVLVRPRRRNQVRGNMRLQKINRELRKCRVKVEHQIGFFKTYRCISEEGGRWRHGKPFLSVVIHLCACLSNRRKRTLES